MNRFGAFAIHLGISLLIFFVLGYLILFHWYPDFFFTSDGGWQGIRIIALVDLVLGPVLTLVVYKKGKPSLRFDLTCIGLFQAACLAAGVWVVHSERPIAMVYSDGSFQSMSRGDYIEAELPVPNLNQFPGSPPYWVTVVLPEDLEKQAALRRESIQQRRSIKLATQFYVPFDSSHLDLSRDGITDQEMKRIGPQLFHEFIQQNGGTVEDYRFLPFGTRYALALIAVHKTDRTLHYLEIPTLLEEAPNQ